MSNPNLELALLVQQRKLALEQIPDPQRSTVRALLSQLSDAQLARLAARDEKPRRFLGRVHIHSRR